MIELKGKYGEAKVFTDNPEEATIGQIINILNQEFTKNANVRIMPDCHVGAGCVIGTTMIVKDKIVPNLVGVDIGCGMLCTSFEGPLDLQKLDDFINSSVPSGMNTREDVHPYFKNVEADKLLCKDHINMERAALSLGTLGGGNHFIEVNIDDEGTKYITIHTGSRGFGKQIADYYQKLAIKECKKNNPIAIKQKADLIQMLKSENRQSEIQVALKKLPEIEIPHKELSFLTGQNKTDYIEDSVIAERYAKWNRRAILDTIVKEFGFTIIDTIDTVHNYIGIDELGNWVIRKGAVSAKKGEKLIIPINMRDGSLLCVGKGNKDWNFSAPHGAGRIYSRSKAKEMINLEDFEDTMKDVFSTSVTTSTIDEAPMAYKPMAEIVANIKDTVDIVKVIKPIYNYKAH